MLTNYDEKVRTLTINFDGEIDHHSCSELAVMADNAINRYVPQKLIFNFKNVKFLDSAGIGMIIGRYKKVMRFGGKAEMINVGKEAKRIFNMAGLFRIIPLIDEENKQVENI